jgi:hypothetical protein
MRLAPTRFSDTLEYRVRGKKILRRTTMKRILISAVLAIALAGTSAFAAQNKNAKKPAAKTSNTAMASNTGTMKAKTKHRRKRKAKAKSASTSNSNSGGTMKAKTKTKNKNM